MKCQEVMELMQRYLDNDLVEAEHQVLLAHLRECPECSDMFDRLKQLNDELIELPRVAPPYSIVDSIMPRLEELVPWTESSAASDTPAVIGSAASPAAAAVPAGHVVSLEKRAERRGLISWKFVSGAAAAALVLGMVIFQMNPSVSNKNADGMLFSSHKSADSGSSKEESSTPRAQSAASEKMAGALADDLHAKDQYGEALNVPSPAAREDKPLSAVTNNPETKPTASTDRQVAAASGGAKPSEPVTRVTSMDADTSKTAKVPPMENSVPEPSKSKDGAAPVPAERVTTVQEAAPLPSAEPVPAPEGDLVLDVAGAADKGAVTGFTVTSAPSPEEPKVSVSPKEAYTAKLKDRKMITIIGKDGRTLYTTSPALKDGERLELGEWKEEGKLTYSILHADGQTTTYLIDVTARSETKI